MAEFIRFEIDGPDGTVAAGQVRANISKLRSEYLPGVMHGIGEFMRRVALKRQFESEGAHLGQRWESLGGRYVAWKQAQGYPAAIGQRTGAMMRAFSGEPHPFSMSGLSYPASKPTSIKARPVLEWSADSVTVGADVTEDGDEYVMKFNEFRARKILGSGKLPSEVEMGIGKILSLAVAASTRIGEMPPDYSRETIHSAALRYINSSGLRAVAR